MKARVVSAGTPTSERPPRRHLLILGGTAEAADLAQAALVRFGLGLDVVTSLAGRLEEPAGVAGRVRVGGFGGAQGLADYLQGHAVDALIDATHPFAANISANARTACEIAGVPRLMLRRPPWRRLPGDRWIEVPDMETAAAALPRAGRRAWLTVGQTELGAFARLTGVWFLVRLIGEPRGPLPLGERGRDFEIVLGRGPFSVARERRLMRDHRIDVLVSKLSGGEATKAKIIAARELELPVVMIQRPPPEPGPCVETVEEALAWLARATESLDGAARGTT